MMKTREASGKGVDGVSVMGRKRGLGLKGNRGGLISSHDYETYMMHEGGVDKGG